MPNPTQIFAMNHAALMAVQSGRRLAMPDSFALLATAQWGLESGYGAAVTGTENQFGIKADGFHGEGSTLKQTHEVINGVLVPKLLPFQNYTSLEECFEDHARIFIAGPLASKYNAWLKYSLDIKALLRLISHPSAAPLYATDRSYYPDVCAMLDMPSLQAAVKSARLA